MFYTNDLELWLECDHSNRVSKKEITGGSIDSRTVKQGDLFFCLPGSAADGHLFALQAREAGASAVIAHISADARFPDASIFTQEYRRQLTDAENIFFVSDPLAALQCIGGLLAKNRTGTGIAVTGSCGKTTVKEMLRHVFAQHFTVSHNPGNLNNHIGVPLSLINAQQTSDYYIGELGASKPGDIHELCTIMCPDIGVITNVAPAHLAGFGSLDGVYKTKAELAYYLYDHGGIVVSDGDDARMQELLGVLGEQNITFGFSAGVDVQAQNIMRTENQFNFTVNGETVSADAHAVLHVKNVLALIAVSKICGLSIGDIRDSLHSFSSLNGRFTVLKSSVCSLIDDSYNANPTSFRNALALFADMRVVGRKVLVCGDMLELGSESEVYHKEIGVAAAQVVDGVIGLGNGGHAIAESFQSVSGGEILCARDHDEIVAYIRDMMSADDIVLFKGSRGMHLERIVKQLVQQEKYDTYS